MRITYIGTRFGSTGGLIELSVPEIRVVIDHLRAIDKVDRYTSALSRIRSRVFTPLDFIGKLVALIPPPLINLTRFFGVFAPNSNLRAQVTASQRGKNSPKLNNQENSQSDKPYHARSMSWLAGTRNEKTQNDPQMQLSQGLVYSVNLPYTQSQGEASALVKNWFENNAWLVKKVKSESEEYAFLLKMQDGFWAIPEPDLGNECQNVLESLNEKHPLNYTMR